MTSYNFAQRAAELGFSKKLESAKHEAVVSGQAIRLRKSLRTDEWEVTVGDGWLEPDVMVTPRGRVLVFTMIGRRALANAG